ncbi:MAG: hypothetical protein WC677_02835 [Clostridia bacterium]|jgi:hypothetical protein
MSGYNVMAILINQRSKKAVKMQEVLTKHGCLIKMRLGLHEADNVCAEDGLLLLQLTGDNSEIEILTNDLNAIDGIKAKTMNISWDE